MRKSLVFLMLVSALLTITGCTDAPEGGRPPSAQKNVTVLPYSFLIPGVERERTLRLYLPPGYEESNNKRYPVLYMHDGQNLFDDATSYAGEWKVDEILNDLARTHGLELIVVGIDNGQEKRMNELSPWRNAEFGEPEGEEYLEFIVDVVKPFIDSNYRTLSDTDNTAIMGSSMGGLISHYAIHAEPGVFGKAGIFSPSYWYSDEVFAYSRLKRANRQAQLYFLVGTKEGPDMVSNMQKMVDQLTAQGHPTDKLHAKVVPGAEHNEGFWSSEFEQAILWLFSDVR